MIRIGLLSDTHSHMDAAILEYLESCEEIWHAGDIGAYEVVDQLSASKPFRAVYGNIDDQSIRTTFPLDLRFELESLSVWMTHIAGYPGKYNKRVREQLQQQVPDIFICGHSHILKVMADPKFGHLHINPGAAGHHGFHQMRTLIRFSIDAGKVKDMEVVELGKRGRMGR